MIDVENIVFDDVFNEVVLSYPNIDATSVYMESPSVFPHYSLYEATHNTARGNTLERETYVRVGYQCDVYSNKSMDEAKQIESKIYDKMLALGFVCTTRQKMPNIDRSVYRITTRFTTVVAKPIVVGEDTVYKTYKN